jgi:hypothetical protein
VINFPQRAQKMIGSSKASRKRRTDIDKRAFCCYAEAKKKAKENACFVIGLIVLHKMP